MAEPEFEWRPATDADLLHVAKHARQADVEELWSASLVSPLGAMVLGIVGPADEVLVGLVRGEPVCVFGVGRPSLLHDLGVPWMVGTDRINFRAKSFLLGSRAVIAGWRQRYGRLANVVDARNLRAIKWLKWLGFCIGDPIPYGPFGLPFHPFELRS